MPPGGIIIAAALIGMAVYGGGAVARQTNNHVVKPVYHHFVQPVGHGFKKIFVHEHKKQEDKKQ